MVRLAGLAALTKSRRFATQYRRLALPSGQARRIRRSSRQGELRLKVAKKSTAESQLTRKKYVGSPNWRTWQRKSDPEIVTIWTEKH